MYMTECFRHLCSASDNSDRLVTILRHFHALYGHHPPPQKKTPPEKNIGTFADLPRKTQPEHIMAHIYRELQYSKKINQQYVLYYNWIRQIPSVVKSKPGFSVETDVIMNVGN
jgi:hypothetical protein